MENHPQAFDVCVVCALAEEARAFLGVVQQQCTDAIGERSSTRYHYSYRCATIKNKKDEPLTLHISWLPRYGPQEMSLHLSHVLEEWRPRIAIMTGICAGDAQRVQLGDLIVAERTFTYDNGKLTLDEHGRRIHEYDTMTYQLDANILQFLGLFDDWKPLVARLKRPPSPPAIRLARREVYCHIKAMASGSAVRTDNPFEDMQAPVRGTVAIDMEGAAFGLVMSRHPQIPWLVAKGVCDYADQDKTDVYHDYAARASAIYALSFIRAYVTNERLPQQPSLTMDMAPPAKPPVEVSVNSSTPPAVRTKYCLPRRKALKLVVAGSIALVAGGIIGEVFWLRMPSPTSTSRPTSQAPTSQPTLLGTTLYTYRGHNDWVLAVAWSSDGKRIASASQDTTVQVWDANNGKPIYTHKGDIQNAVTWSPNGKRIASASYSNVQVWDAADGGNLYTYLGHSTGVSTVWVNAVAWSPNGKRIASGGTDNTVQIWDASTGVTYFTCKGHLKTVNAVAWSPDNKHVASSSDDNTVQVWNATDGNHVYTYRGHPSRVKAVTWSPDGKRIASASENVQVWDAMDGDNLYTYLRHSSWVNAVAWSPDGKHIASGGDDSTVQVWNATDGGNPYTYEGHLHPKDANAVGYVNAVAWSPDGKYIASGSWDKTVQVWWAV